MANRKLKSALRAARRGCFVFPLHGIRGGKCTCTNTDCDRAGKHPRTARGFKDATRDAGQISDWWNRWPTANLGIVTGLPSGFVALDIDVLHGGIESLQKLERQYEKLPVGPCVRTGSGGEHHLFSHPGFAIKSKIGLRPGIDFKGDDAYVVGVGSDHLSGLTYKWLYGKKPSDVALPPIPPWLLELLNEQRSTATRFERSIPKGLRNSTLASLGGVMRSRGMTPQAIEVALLEENRQRCDPPLLDGEVGSIARSISGYEARVPDFDSAYFQEEVEKERKLIFRNAAEFVAATPPRISWIAKPWVAAGSITQVTGKIKAAGKTSWVLGLGRSVLDGKPFMGESTRKTPVVYLSEERMTSFQEALRRADLRDRKDLFLLLSHEIYGRSWASVIRAAAEECKARRAGLLVVDTFAQFAGLAHDQENSAGAAFVALKPLQEAAAQGLAILITHHERKGGGQVSDAGRGSTAIGGAVDVIISLRRPDGNPKRSVRLIQALSRFSETPSDLLIELTADGYKSLGAPGVAARAQYAAEILAVLPHAKRDALTMEHLIKTTKKNRPHLQRMLDALLEEGKIERTGKGRKGHPFAYFAT